MRDVNLPTMVDATSSLLGQWGPDFEVEDHLLLNEYNQKAETKINAEQLKFDLAELQIHIDDDHHLVANGTNTVLDTTDIHEMYSMDKNFNEFVDEYDFDDDFYI